MRSQHVSLATRCYESRIIRYEVVVKVVELEGQLSDFLGNLAQLLTSPVVIQLVESSVVVKVYKDSTKEFGGCLCLFFEVSVCCTDFSDCLESSELFSVVTNALPESPLSRDRTTRVSLFLRYCYQMLCVLRLAFLSSTWKPWSGS